MIIYDMIIWGMKARRRLCIQCFLLGISELTERGDGGAKCKRRGRVESCPARATPLHLRFGWPQCELRPPNSESMSLMTERFIG